MEDKSLKKIAIKEFENDESVYKIVDFLNKSLRDEKIVFGLSVKNDKNIITIYKEL